MKETQENECLKKTFSRGSVYVEIIIILILTKFHSLGVRFTSILGLPHTWIRWMKVLLCMGAQPRLVGQG